MTNHLGIVFPGQGSQSVGMLQALWQQHPTVVEETCAEASEVLGKDLLALMNEGPEESLNQTEWAQPALLTASVAVWRVWQQEGAEAWLSNAYLAGHSLGEYSALVCAGALDFQEAVALVAVRGCLMQQAVPAGTGAMAAIIGLSAEQVIQLCADIDGVVAPANFNSDAQTVISGECSAVTEACVQAKTQGAKLAKLLAVSVPSHCELMTSIAPLFAERLATVSVHKPIYPIINNVDVEIYETPAQIRAALLRQLSQPVRWYEGLQKMLGLGVDGFFECGAGRVLLGISKRVAKGVPAYDNEHRPTTLVQQ